MTVRQLAWSSLFGLGLLGGGTYAAEPAPFPAAVAANQNLADAVAVRVRTSPVLRDYRVDVSALDGRVELTGQVMNAAQREEVIRIAQAVPGVKNVIDGLTTKDAGVRPVQAETPPRLPTPEAGPLAPVAPPAAGGSTIPEPTPIFRAPAPAYSAVNPPAMPPYAWPTYAPHNNYSRVAYPEAYPYNAWPYIGPVYPFPKVPLGWRSVKLEWDDGHWWFSRVGHPHNWWKMRFW